MSASATSNEYDMLARIVLIGDSGVGKSALLHRFTHNSFDHSYISTIGVDFEIQLININSQMVKLQLWDTAGQDRFRAITTSYYRGADGVIVVYDVSNRDSFKNVKYWIEEVRRHCSEECPVLVCGNKADLSNRRQISAEEATDAIEAIVDGSWASQKEERPSGYRVQHFETSAKDCIGVDAAFRSITESAVRVKAERTRRWREMALENANIDLVDIYGMPVRRKRSRCSDFFSCSIM